MDRRTFIEKTGLAGFSTLTMPKQMIGSSNLILQDIPGPTIYQQKWMDLKFGMFVHFGINTYYDKEWSDGTLDPAAFNP